MLVCCLSVLQARVQSLLADVEAERAQREAMKKLEETKRHQLKQQLESQMKENAGRKVVAPMSDIEKLINTQLLKKVETAGINGPQAPAQKAAAAGPGRCKW